MSEPVRVAVLGAGNWGRNHVRTAADEASANLLSVCDPNEAHRASAAPLAPTAELVADHRAIFADPRIEAVAIATPAPTHAALALAAIEAGKHVLVEKPLALSVADARAVAASATERGVVVSVGHILLHHPAVVHLVSLARAGELGELAYLTASRANLGKLRSGENALWSFGPHDLSIADALFGELPTTVTAVGSAVVQADIEDYVCVTLRYRGGQHATLHLSWLYPVKERRVTVVGRRKMARFDDCTGDKLCVFDKSFERQADGDGFAVRSGDDEVPPLSADSPLALEWRDFLACVRTGDRPRSDVEGAVRVIEVLAAAERSLANGGEPQSLEDPTGDKS